MKSLIKNTNKVLTWGLLVLLGACSPAEFLEEKNVSNFTQEGYYTKPEHAETAINAIYASLRDFTNGVSTYGSSPFMMLEFATGLANTDVGQSQDNNTIRALTHNSDNLYVSNWWVFSYRGIANANLAIDRIPGINMDETVKKRLLGEAHFLRAFFYFNLVRLYGDIPLIITPVDASSPELYPSRAPQEEVYNLIVNDLLTSEASGLPETDESGRTSLGAVKSLLASVYLTMAGYPLQKGEEYYRLAAEKAKEVIDSGWYELFDSYEDLHDPAMENKGEHIFMTQYEAGIATNTITAWLLPRNKGISAYSVEFGSVYPSPGFIGTYESGDKRTAEQQFYYTTYPQWDGVSDPPGPPVELGGTFIFKHFDRQANDQTAQSGLNWPLIRFAEVLLTYAEAANEVSGPDPEAYNALKKIRERAELATPSLSSFTQESFREAVWRERWHELSYENKTWFDMVRLRKAFNTSTGRFEDFVGHAFSYGPVLQEKHLLFPLPTFEINNNPELRPQNPGY